MHASHFLQYFTLNNASFVVRGLAAAYLFGINLACATCIVQNGVQIIILFLQFTFIYHSVACVIRFPASSYKSDVF